MIRLFLVLICLSPIVAMKAENPSLNYISQYKQIAVLEMQRTGIPASIKMAQALLESGAGQSTLARKANNHFGIKCGSSWDGETFYREDDDYHKGKLIKSCFRKFDSVHDSYMAHSDFLTKQNRYAFLFDYSTQDYKSWAKGLRKAGYATDKAYSNKLIQIIEKYELYTLDQMHSLPPEAEEIIAMDDTVIPNTKDTKSSEPEVTADRATDLFEAKGTSTGRSKVFRQNAKIHIVRSSETLADIANMYGIDENALRLRNRIPKDGEPLEGETINLRKKISLLNRPQFERLADGAIAASNAEFIF